MRPNDIAFYRPHLLGLWFRWVIALASCVAGLAHADAADVVPPSLTLTRFGETHPAGWMLRQMQADLDDGLVGHFTEISDTVNKELFATTPGESASSAEPYWWSGEHEGYYADGLFRVAWLAGGQPVRDAAIMRLENVLAAQDKDGYIGIYPPDQRFSGTNPNDGELWTQSRMFQALLAWYEATGESRILVAVEKAVKRTLAAYRNKSYFGRPDLVTGGGVSHGVGFADTLEWLYRLTHDDTYRHGYLWLYADYAQGKARDSDLTPANLSDPDKPWYSHTPHIAESLSMPAIALAYGGSDKYAQAADHVLIKLRRHSNPGGGPIGDESVGGRNNSFELTSEYCSMTETIASLNRLAEFRDPMPTGDIAERIALNIAQSARLHPAATAISYLTADNRLAATQTVVHGDRLLFSASHSAASCCALNSSRLLPYYVEGMWLKETTRAGLVARLYGPSTLDTTVACTPVSIVEETDFPFSDKLRFTVWVKKPVTFVLTLRIPEYAHNAALVADSRIDNEREMLRADKTVTRLADRFEVSGKWKSGDSVSLDLAFSVYRVQDSNGGASVAYGPLLYALPVDAIAIPGRITRAQGTTSTRVFYDTEYIAAMDPPNYKLAHDASFAPVPLSGGDMLDPWSKPPTGLAGTLVAPDGSSANVMLHPQGSTLLRVTGFPPADK